MSIVSVPADYLTQYCSGWEDPTHISEMIGSTYESISTLSDAVVSYTDTDEIMLLVDHCSNPKLLLIDLSITLPIVIDGKHGRFKKTSIGFRHPGGVLILDYKHQFWRAEWDEVCLEMFCVEEWRRDLSAEESANLEQKRLASLDEDEFIWEHEWPEARDSHYVGTRNALQTEVVEYVHEQTENMDKFTLLHRFFNGGFTPKPVLKRIDLNE
jgi:hypothetical protein